MTRVVLLGAGGRMGQAVAGAIPGAPDVMLKAFEIRRADTGSVAPIGIITTQPDRPPLFRLRPRL